MPRQLRDYQQEEVGDIFIRIDKGNRRVMAQASTGSGKTTMGCAVSNQWQARNPNAKVLVLVHRNFLTNQWLDTALDMGSDFTVNTVQTYLSKRNKGKFDHTEYDLLILDEAHHYLENSWVEVITGWKGTVVGLTATPWRLVAHEDFRKVYGSLVLGPPKATLIKGGHLVPARVRNPKFKTIEGRGSDGKGDFSVAATMQLFAMDVQQRASMVKYGVDWLREQAPNGKSIIYCLNQLHLDSVKSYCKRLNMKVASITASTTEEERELLFKAFTAGELDALLSIAVLTEGIDLPVCDTILLLRPTMSLVLYLQMVGRCLRPYGDKGYGLVLDACGNASRLGHPDDDYFWALDPRGRDMRLPMVCPVCDTVNPFGTEKCVECGTPLLELVHRAMLRDKCNICGRRMELGTPCAACMLNIDDEEAMEVEQSRALHHRNIKWVLNPDTNEYTCYLPAIMAEVRVSSTSPFIGWMRAVDDEATEDEPAKASLLRGVCKLDARGYVKWKGSATTVTAPKAFKVIDKLTNKAMAFAKVV